MSPRIRLGWIAFVSCLVLASPQVRAATKPAKAQGYLDFRKKDALIVDGQRILTTSKTKFKGTGKAKSIATIPIGYEVVAEGPRQADGSIAATKVTSQPNGMAMFENDVLQATTQAEDQYVKAGKIAEQGADGKEQVLGTLKTSGPEVDRCRKIIDRLLPSYIDPAKVRVYVVDNKEWNAMAMANFSIYVFSGLMKDMDDDELALVLGHELTHATYEHSRKQAKQGMMSGIGAQAVAFGASKVTSGVAKDAAQAGVALGATTFGNVYSREYEDQADRVGLRYAYEAGYDYKKAPLLWKRFAEKYGDQSPVENFFFGNHSLSAKRAAALEQEIKHNYTDPKKDPPTKTAAASK
jgi:Zn-dependent protease with chaperone function